MIGLPFAFLAGLATVASPCILPVLPILLAISAGERNPYRPLAIIAGFVVAFSVAAFLLGAFAQSVGFPSGLLRNIAYVVLAVLGLAMIWPVLLAPVESLSTMFAQFGMRTGGQSLTTLGGGFVTGLSLGLVWTPCAGPILAAILALVASTQNTADAIALLLAYGIGAGLPMLAIAYGGQTVSTGVRRISQHAGQLRRVFGVIVIAVVAAMYFQYDTVAIVWIANLFS